MHFTTAIAAAATVFFGLASARIEAIAVPETIKAGEPFDIQIERFNYIQSVFDVAIAFGYSPGDGYPGSLGLYLDSFYLGPQESNKLNNLTKTLTVPSTAEKGEAVITSSLYSLYGASTSPTLQPFNVTVTIGDVTSSTYKSSRA